MEDERGTGTALAVAADVLEGMAYVMDLVYEDMQCGADARDVSNVVRIARGVLAEVAVTLDRTHAVMDGFEEDGS